jgi:N-acetylneuraminic acid mutarotase
MQKNFYIFLFVICVIATAVTPLDAQWTGWAFRRTITINNTSGSTLTDFQVKINLGNLSPEFNFDNAKPDGSDLRFAASDEVTQIPFWIEKWNPLVDSAEIWVKVPSIPNTGTNIYLYYGNSAATSHSNGTNTFQFFDDFESWNTTPSSAWQDRAQLPTASADLTTAVYDGKLYSFGGYGTSSNNYLNTVYEYNPTTNLWTVKTPMPTARWGMVAVEFNGLIYVFGGQGTANNKNEVYDPANNTWTTRTNIPSGLAQQGLMGIKFGDKIHLFYQSYHYEYDPVGDSYVQKSNVPKQRTWSTSAVVGSKIYLIGGYSYDAPTGANNENYELDPVNDQWVTKTPLPLQMWGATRENPVINGKIYVTHGHNGSVFFTTNYVYDPATNTWEQKGPATHPRDGVACGLINNKLYVVGGRDVVSGPYGLTWNEVYDPAVDTWTPQLGPSQWSTSGTNFVFADNSAKFQGNNGLVIRQTDNVQTLRYAESVAGFGNIYALDFDWNVTDIGGSGGTRPETEIRLTEVPNINGNLFFYNEGTTQVLRWFNGIGFNHLQNSARNSWHKATLIRNGTNSSVIFDGNQYTSPLITSPGTGGTGKFRFALYFATTQYLDNVRVRSFTTNEPTSTVGPEYVNPLPVELSSFSALIIGSSVKLNWRTETEVNNYGFEILRQAQDNKEWTTIGFVNGNGNSNSPKTYSYKDNTLTPGKYSYRLKQIDNDGQFEFSKIIEVDFNSPKIFELTQNYPNPFNPKTSIRFSIPETGNVKLSLYNPLGQEVCTILNEVKESGTHLVNFDASELNSGMYIYKLESGSFVQSKKMILIK